MKGILLYLLFVNVIGFMQMYRDKQKAKNSKYRTPEKRLWQVAVAGGAMGSWIGMNLFRHKTKHTNFKYGMPFLVLAHVGLFVYFNII